MVQIKQYQGNKNRTGKLQTIVRRREEIRQDLKQSQGINIKGKYNNSNTGSPLIPTESDFLSSYGKTKLPLQYFNVYFNLYVSNRKAAVNNYVLSERLYFCKKFKTI